MGLNVTEEIVLRNGLTVNSFYAAIANNTIKIEKISDIYFLSARISFWVSKEARDSSKESIGSREITVDSETSPSDNVYEILYTRLKSFYPNSVDA